jgi:hypothetical protein
MRRGSLDNYNRELAASINKMFANKRRDPNALEIAEFHFDGKALGGEVVDGIRKRLPKIARILEDEYERRACVVGEKYYTLFRDQKNLFPMTAEEEATKYLPLGVGVRPMGIRLCPNADDLIYRAAVKHNLAGGIDIAPKQSLQGAKSERRRKVSKSRR